MVKTSNQWFSKLSPSQSRMVNRFWANHHSFRHCSMVRCDRYWIGGTILRAKGEQLAYLIHRISPHFTYIQRPVEGNICCSITITYDRSTGLPHLSHTTRFSLPTSLSLNDRPPHFRHTLSRSSSLLWDSLVPSDVSTLITLILLLLSVRGGLSLPGRGRSCESELEYCGAYCLGSQNM